MGYSQEMVFLGIPLSVHSLVLCKRRDLPLESAACPAPPLGEAPKDPSTRLSLLDRAPSYLAR